MECLLFPLLWGLHEIWGNSEGEWEESIQACSWEMVRGGWAGKGE